MEIRNISIIAHVDHGKTTLVDGILQLTAAIHGKEIQDRVMDSMDLERERGITIKAKNCTVYFKGTKINIIDTPGHADFGGEVERVLSMADTSLLLVDAFEGPMPQTRFVLDKALKLGHRPILVINKIDRDGVDVDRVLNDVFDLFDDLGATPEQHDFPVVYCSARGGFASLEFERAGKEDKDLTPLLDLVLKHVPPARVNLDAPFQMQVMNLAYDDYVGRLAIGRIFQGRAHRNQNIRLLALDGTSKDYRIMRLYGFEGLNRKEIEEADGGDVVAIAGIDDLNIGETIAGEGCNERLPAITVDEPTVSMYFLVNDSPFAGREGDFVTARQIRARLQREVMTNVALRVIEEPTRQDRFQVQGRGDLHLSVLIETMRREGFELQVSRPEVIFKQVNGKTEEPFETVIIDVPEEYTGTVINELNRRRGEMLHMLTGEHGITRLEYIVPTRGMIGFGSFLVTESRGTAALNSRFLRYAPAVGPIAGRKNGALISMESGKAVGFALFNLQERGKLFLSPGTLVYPGMVVGECSRDNDMDVNPIKEKKLTNVRASGTDEAIRLIPPVNMILEKALEFIGDDELVEVTPQSIRIRKKFLDPAERKKNAKKISQPVA